MNSTRGKPLTQQTVITCMETINRDREGDKEVSSLIIGTEAKQLLFLDPTCTTVELAIALPSVPTHLAVHGLFNVEYRVNVACRDGVVYAVKDKQLMATKIECGSLVCGLVRTEADLFVGTIDNKLHSYHVKGKRNWSVTMPATITAMARLHIRKCVPAAHARSRHCIPCRAVPRARNCALPPAPSRLMRRCVCACRAETWDCVGVALEGGEVRVYNGKSCVATLNCPDTITGARTVGVCKGVSGRATAGNRCPALCWPRAALRFGTYSREANTLVTVSRSGSLTFKMTKRTATFKAIEGAAGPPPEQDIPLPVPKKTKLYVEQTQRERDFAADMHRIFQQELRKLRLATARAFVKTIADGGSALATVSGASLRLNATVAGLGPSFKVKVDFTVRCLRVRPTESRVFGACAWQCHTPVAHRTMPAECWQRCGLGFDVLLCLQRGDVCCAHRNGQDTDAGTGASSQPRAWRREACTYRKPCVTHRARAAFRAGRAVPARVCCHMHRCAGQSGQHPLPGVAWLQVRDAPSQHDSAYGLEPHSTRRVCHSLRACSPVPAINAIIVMPMSQPLPA